MKLVVTAARLQMRCALLYGVLTAETAADYLPFTMTRKAIIIQNKSLTASAHTFTVAGT